MPIIVDTNCLANVFSRNTAKHSEFKPVLNWIIFGKGMLVYGGSKYKAELRIANKYLRIFRLLREVGKAINGNDKNIDQIQDKIESTKDSEKFNDVHLVAISIDTKCRLICSEDIRSIKYVTDRKYFPKGCLQPVFYTSSSNADLLCDKYVDSSLKPLCKIKKSIADQIFEKLP